MAAAIVAQRAAPANHAPLTDLLAELEAMPELEAERLAAARANRSLDPPAR